MAPLRSPDMLYERVVEVDEQVVLPIGSETNQRNGRDAVNSSKCEIWQHNVTEAL